jgi:hypothetical protein
MKPNAIALGAALALCVGAATAQTTTSGTTPSGDTAGGAASKQGPATAGPENSGGVLPTAPPLPPSAATPNVDSEVGGSPGFFRPAPDAVLVPPFTPATPGVTPIDRPTNATVGASPSDTSLRDDIAAAIAADPELQGARINVLVRDGVVTLSGTAQDGAQASRARAMAERLAGSSRVSANISSPG